MRVTKIERAGSKYVQCVEGRITEILRAAQMAAAVQQIEGRGKRSAAPHAHPLLERGRRRRRRARGSRGRLIVQLRVLLLPHHSDLVAGVGVHEGFEARHHPAQHDGKVQQHQLVQPVCGVAGEGRREGDGQSAVSTAVAAPQRSSARQSGAQAGTHMHRQAQAQVHRQAHPQHTHRTCRGSAGSGWPPPTSTPTRCGRR